MESISTTKDTHDTEILHFNNQSNSFQDLDHDHKIDTENINTGTDNIKIDSREELIPSLDFDDLSMIERVSKEGVDKSFNMKSNVDENEIIEWKVLKKALRKEIVLKSNQMFEKYGGLDQLDYLPYNCKLHSNLENSHLDEVSPRHKNIEYSCPDCGKSILENFLMDILEAFDCHTDFPPTIQRICELLLFPDCYNNTKSFLYALDKLVNVSCPIIIEDPDHSETELSCSETASNITGSKRPHIESSNVELNQDHEINCLSSKRLKSDSDLEL
ncbi:hypothetical protein CPHLJ_3g240 [Cryptosporidium parvum]|uniref:Cgd3_240 protein n=1 Tax=Cryptosporidium parvum TaxID=5807 RepID=F0X410_CRYPV|nr:Protein phosphatase 4 core regulatory subunit R2 [Cryptosporidium parvum]WKS76763.1 hypothetical protein CPCDC_3g240 [Cryptosporidium sp. 43IA8]WRK31256.1 Protein phosphatase 4 core regulatory subunit R2 [Cryptosporidium parvum]|eukprot:QOY42371.1 hypothetical protein CPATCC_000993 [Cryptosporidium parvum]